MVELDYHALGLIVGLNKDVRATQAAANREINRAAQIIARLEAENAALKGRVGSLSLKLCQAEARAKRAERSAPARTH